MWYNLGKSNFVAQFYFVGDVHKLSMTQVSKHALLKMAYGIWLANRWNFLTPAIGSLSRGSWQPNFHTGQNFIQNRFDSENMFTDLLWYELKVFLKESYFLAVTPVCYSFVCFKSDAIVCVCVCVCVCIEIIITLLFLPLLSLKPLSSTPPYCSPYCHSKSWPNLF